MHSTFDKSPRLAGPCHATRRCIIRKETSTSFVTCVSQFPLDVPMSKRDCRHSMDSAARAGSPVISKAANSQVDNLCQASVFRGLLARWTRRHSERPRLEIGSWPSTNYFRRIALTDLTFCTLFVPFTSYVLICTPSLSLCFALWSATPFSPQLELGVRLPSLQSWSLLGSAISPARGSTVTRYVSLCLAHEPAFRPSLI